MQKEKIHVRLTKSLKVELQEDWFVFEQFAKMLI